MNDSVQIEEKPMSRCPGCGAEARDGSEFCFNCGEKLGRRIENSAEETTHIENGFRAVAPGAVSKGRERHRRPKPLSREPIQVRWQRDEDPGIRFLIVSVIMGLIAILLIGFGLYLR